MKYIALFIAMLLLISCMQRQEIINETNYPIVNTGSENNQTEENTEVSEGELNETLSEADIQMIIEEIERLARESTK